MGNHVWRNFLNRIRQNLPKIPALHFAVRILSLFCKLRFVIQFFQNINIVVLTKQLYVLYNKYISICSDFENKILK